ncbi:MAG: response regulator transcription factor [Verrucomicrobia bacterium]|nr:response regulator transcription factor [Verrucomicrobiota bacterium]
MIRALLIDDEPAARADLRRLLAAHPEVKVVGEAASVRSARGLLAEAEYDLVFLDIQLLGGSGFDLVPTVRAGARIVFATAHNAFALRAFEVNALDYLLKPIKAARLADALGRLGPAIATVLAPPSEPPETVIAVPMLAADDLVHLPTAHGARFAPVREFGAVLAEENYTVVHLLDGTRHFVRRALKAWEEVLPSALFQRVHRTCIANLTRVVGYVRESPKSIALRIAGLETPLPVSRDLWPEVRARLPAMVPEG